MNPKNPVTWFLQSSLSHTDACAALPTPSPTRFARSLHRGCCRPRGTETAETGTLEFSGAAWRRYPWGWFRSVRGGQAVRVVGYGEGAREEMNLLVSLRMDGPTLAFSVLSGFSARASRATAGWASQSKAKTGPTSRVRHTRSLLEPSRDHHLGKGQCESGTLPGLALKKVLKPLSFNSSNVATLPLLQT